MPSSFLTQKSSLWAVVSNLDHSQFFRLRCARAFEIQIAGRYQNCIAKLFGGRFAFAPDWAAMVTQLT